MSQRLARTRSGRNVALNVVGGVWSGLLIVLATPWFIAKLGLAGYGIVGFWLMLQVLIGLLDMGLGATLVRGFAGASDDECGKTFKRDLLRTLETLYWVIAIILSATLLLVAEWVAMRWLRSESLDANTLQYSLQLIAISLGFQFPNALYSNGLTGLQAHARMNAIQIGANTLRYAGGALVLYWRPELNWFFGAQIIVAATQTFATRLMVWQLVEDRCASPPRFSLRILSEVRAFSAGMAYTAIWAVLLSNSDRLVLSKMVSADQLGSYAVAFTACGFLQLGIQPFYRTYFPRYSELFSLNDRAMLRLEYYRSCRVMANFLIPAGTIGFVFAPQLLFVWLGAHDQTISDTLRLLILAITCSGLMWLPAAFQQAHGWTKLHTQMMAGAVIVGTPLMIIAIQKVGVPGATTVWILHGISEITLGLWLMHRRLLVGELARWYKFVVALPLLLAAAIATFSASLMPSTLERGTTLLWILVTGVLTLAPLFLAHEKPRDQEI